MNELEEIGHLYIERLRAEREVALAVIPECELEGPVDCRHEFPPLVQRCPPCALYRRLEDAVAGASARLAEVADPVLERSEELSVAHDRLRYAQAVVARLIGRDAPDPQSKGEESGS